MSAIADDNANWVKSEPKRCSGNRTAMVARPDLRLGWSARVWTLFDLGGPWPRGRRQSPAFSPRWACRCSLPPAVETGEPYPAGTPRPRDDRAFVDVIHGPRLLQLPQFDAMLQRDRAACSAAC